MHEGGWIVRGATRSEADGLPLSQHVRIDAVDEDTDWKGAAGDIDAVIHLAARAHVLRETEQDPLALYRKVNCGGTLRLARAARAAGVRRFVFVSTVGVCGRSSAEGALAEESPCRPEDAYSTSKWEAEQGLAQVARETGLEVVILRSPLVYGPGNPGNILRLLDWVERGVPLPFAAVDNRRSLIGVRNLVDALMIAATHPAAAGRTFVVSDGEDVSTAGLIELLAGAMGRSARLFKAPRSLLRAAAWMLGRGRDAERLLGSLRVDSARIRKELGWSPPGPMKEELSRVAEWYLETRTSGGPR
jgi:nucleoside-diphosphate-sugar epimerase